jgi:hypothetical protein
MLMLLDNSGEIKAVKFDPNLVTSDNAVIVLDEYNDTCWVWIGRNVSMPTRMHAIRMGKSVQKSGHKVGNTTVGMALSRIVEMNEKSDSDPEVAASMSSFRNAMKSRWSYEDEILAFDESRMPAGSSSVARRSEAPPTLTAETVAPTSRPQPTKSAPPPPRPSTAPPASRSQPPPQKLDRNTEQKLAFLILSAVKHADVVYTEKFTRDGKPGIKVEAPGVIAFEAIVDGNTVKVTPPDFGGSEAAARIRAEYESLTGK